MSNFIFNRLDYFAEWAFELKGGPFSLKERDYLRPIYKTIGHPDIKKVILKFGRQTEKCVHPLTWVSSEIGLPFRIMTLKDSSVPVLSWNGDGSNKASKDYIYHNNGIGRIYKVSTSTGRELYCSASHLLLCKEELSSDPMWVPAIMSRGMWIAEPNKAWKFLDHDRDPYDAPTPYMFGLNEKRSWDTAERIGLKGTVDLKSEEDARYYQAFLSKLGILSHRKKRFIEVFNQTNDKLIWSKIIDVKKESYGQWVDIEVLGGPPSYSAEGMVVHNSTTMAACLLSFAAMISHTNILCVNPTDLNLQHFSRERLDPFMRSSRFYNTCVSQSDEQAIMTKTLANGSKIFLRSAYRHADRSRGISADILVIDEIQDVKKDNIQVVNETLSHSSLAKRIYSGTPKTYDNPLEAEWLRSKQYEYVIKCLGCKKYNALDERNIGTIGPVCSKCGKLIDRGSGIWVSMSPSGESEGFRFPAISAPWVEWGDILYKLETYSRQTFYNEVLALSCDIGISAIPASDVINSCDSKFTENWEEPPRRYSGYDFFVGVDWGTVEYGSTVVCVIMRERSKYRVVHARAFKGVDAEPDKMMNELIRLAGAFRAKLIGVDWGGQMSENSRLRERLGHDRIAEFFYIPTGRRLVKYDIQSGRTNLAREQSLAELFNEISAEKYRFPSWESKFQVLARHFMNMIIEHTESQRISRYSRKIGERDDFVHALNYARCAARIFYNEWIA